MLIHDTIKFQGAIYKLAATSKSWDDYVIDAQQLFLKDLAKKIQETAGGHAETVSVERSGSSVWLEYKGQDLSDLDLEWTCHLILKGDLTYMACHVRSVQKGEYDKVYGAELTIDQAHEYFLAAFGAH